MTYALSSRSATGTVLEGRYLLEQELGSGGLGIVYKARHIALEAPVAVKMLRPEYAYDTELVTRLREEARLAACLRSDHVVRVLDVGELEHGAVYVVLEYVEGHDLETELAHRGRLTVAAAVRYALHTCAALAEAHAHGVVHRDIKPENLLLERRSDAERRLKVADFGAAKRILGCPSALRDPGGYVGTPWYMAPEQILDSREVDGRADIWSLGVVLYEMLADRLPFNGDTPPEVYTSIVNSDLVSLRTLRPDVPRDLERVVRRCLEKNRDERYACVGEVASALGDLGLAEEPDPADSVVRRLGALRAAAPVLGE